jgi:tetratricopeptide (TPR) repeat protein
MIAVFHTSATPTELLLDAVRCQRAARYTDAERLYWMVLTQHPDDARPARLYGMLLLSMDRALEAVPVLRKAVDLEPAHAGARLHLGRALLAVGQPDAALVEIHAASVLDPGQVEAAFLRGTALAALRKPALAVAAFSECLARHPDHAAAHLNLGNCYVDMDRLVDAEYFCRRAVSLDPGLAEAHASLGFLFTSLGRLDEAIAACQAAIRLRPEFAQAHWNLAVAALLSGDFTVGFREYEWRKRHDRFNSDFVRLPGLEWDGSELGSHTLLVRAEQGAGDTIQFARYLPIIAASGTKVVLACNRVLTPLLSTLPGVIAADKDQPLPDFDFWVDQMSLPLICGTRPDTIPLAEGYLCACAERQAAWRKVLPAGHKVGVAWAGNPLHANDRHRSLSIAALRYLLATPQIAFINLQIGPRASEGRLASLPLPLTDYAETAALIANLDLVVTVDTSVAHLAGALGVPCWIMLPFAPDWRWQLGREDSPWYLSARLFRQPSSGDWDAVVREVRDRLVALH